MPEERVLWFGVIQKKPRCRPERAWHQHATLSAFKATEDFRSQQKNTPVVFIRNYSAAPSICIFDLPRSVPQGYY
jgi:hypothetical protein